MRPTTATRMSACKRLPNIAFCLACIAFAAGCATGKQSSASADVRYKRVSDAIGSTVTGGKITDINWADDGKSVSFKRNQQNYRYDLNARKLIIENAPPPVPPAPAASKQVATTQPRRRSGPGRGKQYTQEGSPDGKWNAICKDWNVIIEPVGEVGGVEEKKQGADEATGTSDAKSAGDPISVTTTGNRKFRYGAASWVYGEELDQHEAMWWSPDSSKLAFYEFDERLVPDHYITNGLTDLHTTVMIEGYPKPGEPNPIANLLIYDLKTQQTTRVDLPDATEWYTYNIRFSPNGSELLFNRTNRHQNTLHLMAADPATGKTRIILTETQPTWQDNAPQIRFLMDNHRFIWATEKSGYRQYELRDLDGTLINTITRGDYPAASIVDVDEEGENGGVLFYTAFSDSNPLNTQFQRVNLDGSDPRRLTQEPFNHSIKLSPDRKWFVTEYEAADTPPTTALYSTDEGDGGGRIATLATSDLTKFNQLGLELPELFTFKADDNVTDLYGVLFKPSHFDKSKKYPLVIDVYGGPLSNTVRNRFVEARAACEYGFIIAQIDNRGTANRGKAFEAAAYLKLGDVDIRDQAAGVRHLTKRSYIDSSRVGIYGHSYGGYMSALALLKFPDLFHAAVAGGTVSDWRNYDSIYTERFMRTPQENAAGYDAGSCLTYVKQLKGDLLLMHGMVDDNVHANNFWQLVDALQKESPPKPFQMMLYPNDGHGLSRSSADVRWQFLRKSLLN